MATTLGYVCRARHDCVGLHTLRSKVLFAQKSSALRQSKSNTFGDREDLRLHIPDATAHFAGAHNAVRRLKATGICFTTLAAFWWAMWLMCLRKAAYEPNREEFLTN